MQLKEDFYINKYPVYVICELLFYDPTSENGIVISVNIRLYFKERKESRQRKERNTNRSLTKI